MQWFRDLRVQLKLFLGFFLVIVCTGVVGFTGLEKLSRVRASTVDLGTNWLPSVVILRELTMDTENVRRMHYQSVAHFDDAEVRASYAKRIADVEADLIKVSAEYEKMISSDGERINFPIFRQKISEYVAIWPAVRELARSGKKDEAFAQLLAARGTLEEARKALGACTEANVDGANKAMAQAHADYDTARTTIFLVLGLGVALAIAIALLIGRMIARPLGDTVRILDRVAKGDFSPRVPITQQDEIGRTGLAVNATLDSIQGALKEISSVLEGVAGGDLTRRTTKIQDDDLGRMGQTLNRSLVSMHGALEQVRSVADEVAAASQQLASAATEISSGAQQQASSLEETAASLEEITSTVKQSSDNAHQAKQLAVGSRESAERGGGVVEKAITAMAEINESSTKIADIITTIDEIAFQTNILALNAAVEAARAGEQGRGFAVVAERVGNLSQRSAAAAKEIKGLITDSVRKVQGGTELVNRSGQSLQEIVSSVKRVTDIVGEMASAFGEQSTGLDQVNTAITQMDSVTQANASQTEELSATAESLSSKSEELLELVGRFRLENQGGGLQGRPGTRARAVAPRSTPKARPAAPARGRGAAPRQWAKPAASVSSKDPAPDAAGSAMDAVMEAAGASKNGHHLGSATGTFEEV